MNRTFLLVLFLLLPLSRASAAPKASVGTKSSAVTTPAQKNASAESLEDEPICPDDLEKAAVEKERTEAATRVRKPVKSALDVWNPYQKADENGVGRGFSRYSGQDEYQASGDVAGEGPPRHGSSTHSAPPPRPSSGGGLRIRRG